MTKHCARTASRSSNNEAPRRWGMHAPGHHPPGCLPPRTRPVLLSCTPSPATQAGVQCLQKPKKFSGAPPRTPPLQLHPTLRSWVPNCELLLPPRSYQGRREVPSLVGHVTPPSRTR